MLIKLASPVFMALLEVAARFDVKCLNGGGRKIRSVGDILSHLDVDGVALTYIEHRNRFKLGPTLFKLGRKTLV